MQQIRQKATSAGTLANPIALARLVSAAGDNIDTDLSVSNLRRLNELTHQTQKQDIYSIVFNTDPGGFLVQDNRSSDLLPEDGTFDDIRAFTRNVFKVGPIWSEHPTIQIQNGTDTAGLGSSVSKKITSDGYAITINSVTNALTRDHATSEIIDYSGGKKPNTVNYLKGLLGVKTITPPPTATSPSGADIVVIVGADYAAKASSANNSSSTTDTPSNSVYGQ